MLVSPKKKVTVWLEDSGKYTRVAGPYRTIKEAEDFLATSKTVDTAHLHAGHYTIDYPEELNR